MLFAFQLLIKHNKAIKSLKKAKKEKKIIIGRNDISYLQFSKQYRFVHELQVAMSIGI